MADSEIGTVGARLSQLLDAAGLSHREVARRLDVTQPTVSAWIKGTITPRQQIIQRIADTFGVDAAWLQTGLGQPPVNERALRDAIERAEWIWRVQPADAGRDLGNPNRHVFSPRISDFVREVLQNIGDAGVGPVVEAHFRLTVLRGEPLRRFLSALGWEDGLRPHLEANAQQDNRLGRGLKLALDRLDQRGELVLLTVEDRPGVGLTGEEDGRGHFAALLRNNLDSQKDATTGGSFGLGKAVMWVFSQFAIVVFNSRLSAADPRGRLRLMGKAELGWRQVDNINYAGPGWFGERDETAVGPRAVSMWDESELGEALHLARPHDEPGTSVLIVGFHDPAGEADRPDEMADAIAQAAAQHFWPAIVGGRLRVTVSVADGSETRSAVVDADRYEAAYADLYRKYRAGEAEDTLGPNVGDVAAVQVPLNIPARIASDPHAAMTHEPVLVVRRAAADDIDASLSRVAFFRGVQMVVMSQDARSLAAGGVPFHACVLAGEAVDGTPQSRAAERFLRAAEPPAHNVWTTTPELKTEYARGARTSLDEFVAAVRAALARLISPPESSEEEGPEALKQLLRFQGDVIQPSKPRIVGAEGRVRDNAWEVTATVRVKPGAKGWRGEPVVVFLAETGGGVPVAWRTLEAEGATVTDEGVLVLPAGRREARLRGTTDPASHPVDASEAEISVEFRNAKESAA